MFARLQRALLFVLLSIVPLQSMAATIVPLLCAQHVANRIAITLHTGEKASAAHLDALSHHGDTGQSEEAHRNLCCHQFISTAPEIHAYAPPRDFRVYVSAVEPLTPLHFPELPQRPPRV